MTARKLSATPLSQMSAEQKARVEKLYAWMAGYDISIPDVARQLGWPYSSARQRLIESCPPQYKERLRELGFPLELLPPEGKGRGRGKRPPRFPGLMKNEEKPQV